MSTNADKSFWTVNLQNIPIDLLDPDPENMRVHDDENLNGISESLRKYGLQKPIVVVPKAGGRFKVIAGNGTLRVARGMGAPTISASISGLEGLRQVGYAIADNRTGETSTWNYQRLRGHLENLQSAGFNMPATAWSPPTIANLLSVQPLPVGPAPAAQPPAQTPAEDEDAGDRGDRPRPEPEPPSEFQDLTAEGAVKTTHKCPRCAYEWSGAAK